MFELNHNWDIKITMRLVDEDRYFVKGTRLAYDQPWQIFEVLNDLPYPYYRIYVDGRCMGFANSETEAYDRVRRLTPEQTHNPAKR